VTRFAGSAPVCPTATGHVSPSGQLWQVPRYPRPKVVLDEDTVRIDDTDVPVADGQEPRDAAITHLVAQARRLRGEHGAIHAVVRAQGSADSYEAIVTGSGEVFDPTPAAPAARPGMSGRRGRWVLAAGGAVVAVLVFAIALALSSGRGAPTPVGAAPPPPPTGVPTEYPALPPPGFSGRADWSAPILGQSEPLISSDGSVITLNGTTSASSISVRDPNTGVPVFSVPLPQGVVTSGGGGLHLSLIDGQEVITARTTDTLLWWVLGGVEHPARSVPLPAQAAVSFAGSTPLVSMPGQHAALVVHDQLIDYVVPAGAVALGGVGTTIVAANSVGQLWRLHPGTAQFPTAPVGVATPVAGAVSLASVGGYSAPFPAGTAHPELLVLTWYTTDPAARIVSLLDAGTAAAVGTPVPVPANELSSTGWHPSEHNILGVYGPVLVDVGAAAVHVLPSGWQLTHISDTAAYGTQQQTNTTVTPTGQLSPTGSGITPVGMTGRRAVVTATAGNTSTVYGLPLDPAAPLPTPSVPVSAPPAVAPTNPVPSGAPTPTTTTPPPPPPVPGPPPGPPAARPPPAAAPR